MSGENQNLTLLKPQKATKFEVTIYYIDGETEVRECAMVGALDINGSNIALLDDTDTPQLIIPRESYYKLEVKKLYEETQEEGPVHLH